MLRLAPSFFSLFGALSTLLPASQQSRIEFTAQPAKTHYAEVGVLVGLGSEVSSTQSPTLPDPAATPRHLILSSPPPISHLVLGEEGCTSTAGAIEPKLLKQASYPHFRRASDPVVLTCPAQHRCNDMQI